MYPGRKRWRHAAGRPRAAAVVGVPPSWGCRLRARTVPSSGQSARRRLASCVAHSRLSAASARHVVGSCQQRYLAWCNSTVLAVYPRVGRRWPTAWTRHAVTARAHVGQAVMALPDMRVLYVFGYRPIGSVRSHRRRRRQVLLRLVSSWVFMGVRVFKCVSIPRYPLQAVFK